ncbi:hypothetical protein ABPG75_004444 [Micractinium tetrahymenae]
MAPRQSGRLQRSLEPLPEGLAVCHPTPSNQPGLHVKMTRRARRSMQLLEERQAAEREAFEATHQQGGLLAVLEANNTVLQAELKREKATVLALQCEVERLKAAPGVEGMDASPSSIEGLRAAAEEEQGAVCLESLAGSRLPLA